MGSIDSSMVFGTNHISYMYFVSEKIRPTNCDRARKQLLRKQFSKRLLSDFEHESTHYIIHVSLNAIECRIKSLVTKRASFCSVPAICKNTRYKIVGRYVCATIFKQNVHFDVGLS